MKIKKCSWCQTFKPFSEFYKNKYTKTGLTSLCKKCLKLKVKKYAQIHKKIIEKSRRNFSKKHPRYQSEYQLKWKKSHLNYSKIYYKLNREKKLKIGKIYYQDNKQSRKAYGKKYGKKYYKKNQKIRKAYAKSYFQTSKGKAVLRASDHQRRILLQNCKINDLTSTQIEILLRKAKKCIICKKQFTKMKRRKTLDHIIPLSRGGNHTLINIQIVCQSCNAKKHTQDYFLFNGGQLYLFT